VIIVVPRTGERIHARLAEDDSGELCLAEGRFGQRAYVLQAVLAIGWQIVEVTPDERTLLAAHGSGHYTEGERSLPRGRHEHQLVQDQESRVHTDDRSHDLLDRPNTFAQAASDAARTVASDGAVYGAKLGCLPRRLCLPHP
jgi:hypothetical protein